MMSTEMMCKDIDKLKADEDRKRCNLRKYLKIKYPNKSKTFIAKLIDKIINDGVYGNIMLNDDIKSDYLVPYGNIMPINPSGSSWEILRDEPSTTKKVFPSIYNSYEDYQNHAQISLPSSPTNRELNLGFNKYSFDPDVRKIYNNIEDRINSIWYKILKFLFHISINIREQHILDIYNISYSIIDYIKDRDDSIQFRNDINYIIRYINNNQTINISTISDIKYILTNEYSLLLKMGVDNNKYNTLIKSLVNTIKEYTTKIKEKIQHNLDNEITVLTKTIQTMENYNG